MNECYIIGAGPSIHTQQDEIQTILSDDAITVIALNSAILLTNWSNTTPNPQSCLWLSTDRSVQRWNYFKQVCTANITRHVGKSWRRDLETLAPIKFHVFDQEIMTGSSALCALDLAITRGYKRIYLYGIDHCSYMDKTHFWEFFAENKRPLMLNRQGTYALHVTPIKQQAPVWKSNTVKFKQLSEKAKNMGATIINKSPISTLECFEKE